MERSPLEQSWQREQTFGALGNRGKVGWLEASDGGRAGEGEWYKMRVDSMFRELRAGPFRP